MVFYYTELIFFHKTIFLLTDGIDGVILTFPVANICEIHAQTHIQKVKKEKSNKEKLFFSEKKINSSYANLVNFFCLDMHTSRHSEIPNASHGQVVNQIFTI